MSALSRTLSLSGCHRLILRQIGDVRTIVAKDSCHVVSFRRVPYRCKDALKLWGRSMLRLPAVKTIPRKNPFGQISLDSHHVVQVIAALDPLSDMGRRCYDASLHLALALRLTFPALLLDSGVRC